MVDDLLTPEGIRKALLRTPSRTSTDEECDGLDGLDRDAFFDAGYEKALREFAARLPWAGQAWTDYPIEALGDKPKMPYPGVPIREVVVLSYDGDKYATVEVEGVRVEVKVGYLYLFPAKQEWGQPLTAAELRTLPRRPPAANAAEGAQVSAIANSPPERQWLYISARDRSGVIRAMTAQDAWEKASRIYRIRLLVSEKGEAYMVSVTPGKCAREPGADWSVRQAKKAIRESQR
jgi:hypothetical protein